MENTIPIENIYFMLCYAWGALQEKEIINTNPICKKDLPNLFANVLANNLEKLIKKGFDREYILECDEIAGIKGKINFQNTINKLAFNNAKSFCEFDDLSYDNLQNQIIKTTVLNLINSKLIERSIEDKLIKIYRYFSGIQLINLSSTVFSKVRIHRNNSFYGFIINICELIYNNLLIDENQGKTKFKDFIRDEKAMARVFENFVRNFYKAEQNLFKVNREDIHWNIVVIEGKKEMLPKMQTDVSLENENRKIIIDTKYYKDALAKNFDSYKFRAHNLYQISSYLQNVENKASKTLSGILIYPQVSEEIDFSAKTDAFEIKIKTLNLDASWENIHKRLLEIIK